MTFSLGAGSVLETLQAGRPLIVVINELLMDNHQMELASQLAEDGHLCYATCRCGQINGHMIYTGVSIFAMLTNLVLLNTRLCINNQSEFSM